MYIRFSPVSRSCGFAGAAHTYGTNLVKLFRNREIPAVPTYRPSKRRKRVSLSKDLRDFQKQGEECVPNGPVKWGIRLRTKCSQRLRELQEIVRFNHILCQIGLYNRFCPLCIIIVNISYLEQFINTYSNYPFITYLLSQRIIMCLKSVLRVLYITKYITISHIYM